MAAKQLFKKYNCQVSFLKIFCEGVNVTRKKRSVFLRDLIALEGMMRQHQELKAKIDGRSKTIQQCADLGKILIAAGNPASEEV